MSGVSAAFREGDGRKAAGVVKVLVDVEGIEGSIESAERGTEAEPFFSGRHQRVEVGYIRLVKRLGQFGQDDLAPLGPFGRDNARGVALVEFADGQGVGGHGLGGRCGQQFMR